MKKAAIIISSVLAGAALLAAMLFVFQKLNHWRLQMSEVSPERVTIECFDEWQDPEVHASFIGDLVLPDGLLLEVVKEGSVDNERVGTYELSWRAEFREYSEERRQTVQVVDTVDPVLTLVPETRPYILPGTEYEDPGFSAFDAVDGDLTAEVKREVQDGQVFYSVSDHSGNTVSASRTIPYDDPVAPEIELLGDAEVELTAGEEYVEAGATASDNLDGDLTDQVRIIGRLDTETPGTYELVYLVQDSYHHYARVSRTITVLEPPPPPEPEPEPEPQYVEVPGIGTFRKVAPQVLPEPGVIPEKVIYLTFDDGPSSQTNRLLDILKKYNVKATFFVTAQGLTDPIAREAAEGHTVAVHTYCHRYEVIYASDQAFFDDLWRMNEIIKAKTGQYSSMMRFPGGSSNTVSRKYSQGIMTRLVKEVTDAGFTYFDWNVTSGDAGSTKDANVIYQNVINGISGKNVAIVLQHDLYGYSVDAVEPIIIWGLEHGYTFLPLTPNSPTSHHKVQN